MRMMREHRIHT